jgi:alkylation response protein AidB-like acyl-CoA dehydrogenase
MIECRFGEPVSLECPECLSDLAGPLYSTVALSGAVISASGSPEQKCQLLKPICRGEACVTLAMLESGASWDHRELLRPASVNVWIPTRTMPV